MIRRLSAATTSLQKVALHRGRLPSCRPHTYIRSESPQWTRSRPTARISQQPQTLASFSSTSSRSRATAATVSSNSIHASPAAIIEDSSPPQPWAKVYTPPTTGLLSYLPASVVPYAELARLNSQIGTYYLFLPCVWSTLLAAITTSPTTPPSTVLSTTALFFAGAIIMRGAGCTINDIWDRNLDPHVARTRLRPLARRAVSLPSAVIFCGAQCLAGLAVLLQFPWSCFWYATPSLLFVTAYPLAKRVTYYPQFMLGLTFSWGAIMGFPALGVDLLSNTPALTAAAALYASNVAWTVAYDMVYAHMDLKDDAKAGIKSMVRAHSGKTKPILTALAAAQTGLLAAAGAALGVGPAYYIGVCGASIVGNAVQIYKVRLDDPANCWWWFRKGVWITGGTIAAGMGLEYGMQYLQLYEKVEETTSE